MSTPIILGNILAAPASEVILGNILGTPGDYVVLGSRSNIIPRLDLAGRMKYGDSWPPTKGPVNSTWTPVAKYTTDFDEYILIRGFGSYNLMAVTQAPLVALLVVNCIASGGEDISVCPYATAYPYGFGSLTTALSTAISGPFKVGKTYVFSIDPALLTLESYNYIALALTNESIKPGDNLRRASGLELGDLYLVYTGAGTAVPCQEADGDLSMIWRSGPPDDYTVADGAGVYIGNYNWMVGEDLFYDLDRVYLSFDLTAFTSIVAAKFRAAAFVHEGVTDQAAHMEIGVFLNSWGPTLTEDDFGSIAEENLISNTISGPFANGQKLTWTLDPTKLVPGEINYLMIADLLESALVYSEGNDLQASLYLSSLLYDPIAHTNWKGILPHLIIYGE